MRNILGRIGTMALIDEISTYARERYNAGQQITASTTGVPAAAQEIEQQRVNALREAEFAAGDACYTKIEQLLKNPDASTSSVNTSPAAETPPVVADPTSGASSSGAAESGGMTNNGNEGSTSDGGSSSSGGTVAPV